MQPMEVEFLTDSQFSSQNKSDAPPVEKPEEEEKEEKPEDTPAPEKSDADDTMAAPAKTQEIKAEEQEPVEKISNEKKEEVKDQKPEEKEAEPEALPMPKKKPEPKKEEKKPKSEAALPKPVKKPPMMAQKKEKKQEDALESIVKNLIGANKGADGKGKKSDAAKNTNAGKVEPGLLSRWQSEIMRQMSPVLNIDQTGVDNIDFHLLVFLGPDGTIKEVEIENADSMNGALRAIAESAKRATKRLGKFDLPPAHFKPDLYDHWKEVRINIKPTYY